MTFELLAADSMGVRSLATWVPDAPGGGLLIDPGAALGPTRYGLPPHPQEEKALAAAALRIAETAGLAGRIVITHFHHDHFVPFDKEQWIVSGAEFAEPLYRNKIVYIRDLSGPLNPRQRGRARRLVADLELRGIEIRPMDARSEGDLLFSPPFQHGDDRSPGGWVVMVAVLSGTDCLVHLSDTQLLNDGAIDWTLERRPNVVITAGPPLYLPQLHPQQVETAKRNLRRLVERVPHVIVDHHLRRGGTIEDFLAEATELTRQGGYRLESAAVSCGRTDALLESRRRDLWEAR